MKITGIQSGMVMQRNYDNLCDIFFNCDEKASTVKCSDKWSSPTLTEENGRYRLSGIRVGGPYTLNINGAEFTDIYVGDVWLLAGQSNMQGIGRKINESRNTNPYIRAYYMDERWDIANHPLHELGRATGYVHTVELNEAPQTFIIQGAGPGLSFAEKMYELNNVPQGVIACAHGGTNLKEQWNPDIKDKGYAHSLYAAALKRFSDNGGNIKGIFWYQGCSDADEEKYESYTDNMIKLVKAFRRDFGKDLPIVEVQICRNSWAHNRQEDIYWTSIREQQRTLHTKIDKLDTVHTVAYDLEDCIHITAKSQKNLGRDAAESMYCLTDGKRYGCLPGIKLGKIELVPDIDSSNVIIHFENVHGGLTAGARAMGFDSSAAPGKADNCGIERVECDGNRVILHCSFTADIMKDRYIYYGYGINPPCNIVDGHGRPIPAFGPIKVVQDNE